MLINTSASMYDRSSRMKYKITIMVINILKTAGAIGSFKFGNLFTIMKVIYLIQGNVSK